MIAMPGGEHLYLHDIQIIYPQLQEYKSNSRSHLNPTDIASVSADKEPVPLARTWE